MAENGDKLVEGGHALVAGRLTIGQYAAEAEGHNAAVLGPAIVRIRDLTRSAEQNVMSCVRRLDDAVAAAAKWRDAHEVVRAELMRQLSEAAVMQVDQNAEVVERAHRRAIDIKVGQ